MTKDILSETLTKIRNAVLIKDLGVEVPKTRIIKKLALILLKEGFVEDVSEAVAISKKKKTRFLFFPSFEIPRYQSHFCNNKYTNCKSTWFAHLYKL
jgi:ribosomal protein S8